MTKNVSFKDNGLCQVEEFDDLIYPHTEDTFKYICRYLVDQYSYISDEQIKSCVLDILANLDIIRCERCRQKELNHSTRQVAHRLYIEFHCEDSIKNWTIAERIVRYVHDPQV